MKKTLSIILAILMLVTMIPFTPIAFAATGITHQPTIDELYVETNIPNPSYKWCVITDGFVFDNQCPYAQYYTSPLYWNFAYYNQELGAWYPAYEQLDSGNYSMGFLYMILCEGDVVTFEFSSDEIDKIYIDDQNKGIRYEFDYELIPDGNIATFTAEEDSIYALHAEAKEILTVKVSSTGEVPVPIEGETSAHFSDISKLEDGKTKEFDITITEKDGKLLIVTDEEGFSELL